MRALTVGLLLAAIVFPVSATEPVRPIAILLEPLGESAEGVVARVSFRFATPPEVPEETGLFLQGSFLQGGTVLRNFRYPVPPEQRSAVSLIQTLSEGPVEIEVRLIMPLDEGAPVMIAKTSEKFDVVKTGKPYVASAADGPEAIVAEGVVPENIGAVTIRTPRRDVALNLFIVDVDVIAPVTRVEFWAAGKKILARNSPPYSAELDLGKLPKRVEVRAVGYDAAGRYVDADAFVVNERETPLELKITRTMTPDGVSHIKLSLQNPKNTAIRSVTLYAGDRKIQEWSRPPYAIDLPVSALAGSEFIRASAIDDTGYEASDLLFLSGDRFMESIEVHLVELPVSVTDASGTAITDLEAKNFSVSENGKPQKISNFNFAANLPISVGVLLDHSGSMEKRMSDVKAAAISFFRSILRPTDRAFIGAFAGDPSRTAPFVSSLETLEAQVNAIPEAKGGTALYDAIVTGLYRFRNLQGRKALVVLTDGEDTASRLEWNDMLTYARASRVPIYFIGIGFTFGNIGGPGMMRDLAAETGGNAYFIKSTAQLNDAYAQLEKDLRTQYLLSYYIETTTKDQEYRTVEVKVDRPDARVRTIRGYIP